MPSFFTDAMDTYKDWIHQFQQQNSDNDENSSDPTSYVRDWYRNPPTAEELPGLTAEELGHMFGGGIEGFDPEKFAELHGGSKPLWDSKPLEIIGEQTDINSEMLRDAFAPKLQESSDFYISGRDTVNREENEDLFSDKYKDIALSGELRERSVYSDYEDKVREWLRWLTGADVFTSQYWEKGGDGFTGHQGSGTPSGFTSPIGDLPDLPEWMRDLLSGMNIGGGGGGDVTFGDGGTEENPTKCYNLLGQEIPC